MTSTRTPKNESFDSLSQDEIQLIRLFRATRPTMRIEVLGVMRETAKSSPVEPHLKLVTVAGQRLGGNHA